MRRQAEIFRFSTLDRALTTRVEIESFESSDDDEARSQMDNEECKANIGDIKNVAAGILSSLRSKANESPLI